MEEVWKDITLTTLHQERPITSPNHQSYHRPASSSSLRAMTLEGFLAGPLNRPLTLSPPAVEELPLRPPPPPPALPQTALSLNSGMEFQCLGPHADSRSNSSSNGQHAYFIARPPSATGLFSFCSKKRWPEKPATGVDRQHRRMIKNRESAARSRARKQAYTNQLELEVSHLKEENAKLKKQYEELRSAMATKLPKRNTFRRSSTAPF